MSPQSASQPTVGGDWGLRSTCNQYLFTGAIFYFLLFISKDIDGLAKDQVSCITDLLKEKLTEKNIKAEIGNPLKELVWEKFNPVYNSAMATAQSKLSFMTF